jgi:DNA replication protein DnaC
MNAHPASAMSCSPVWDATPLLVADEVDHIPFEAEAAKLFLQLLSSRYERASLDRHPQQAARPLGEVFGVTASVIDRLVHHAVFLALKRRQLPAQRRRPRPLC